MSVPPMPVPERLRGATVVVVFPVSEHGTVEQAALSISMGGGSPLPDAAYERRLREMYGRARFDPAVLEGCAVPQHASLELHL